VLCPRCASNLDLINKEQYVEYYNSVIITKEEYFCSRCRSALIETWKDENFYSSDWIDFNG